MDLMKGIFCAEINGFGLIVLALMYFGFDSSERRKSELDQKLFRSLLVINAVILVSDTATWILNGTVFPFARELSIASTVIYYITQPLMCMVWLMYCDYMLYSDRNRLKRRLAVYSLPAVTVGIMSVLSGFYPIFFSIDGANIYHREKYYHVAILCTMIYIVWSIVLTLIRTHRQNTSRHKLLRKFFILFPIPPVIGIIVQSLFFSGALTWVLCCISLLIIYFYLQNQQITTDALTGLNNRRRFESYMEDKIKSVSKGNQSFILMIDVDSFKSINDTYGHAEGDRALRVIAGILRQCVDAGDFIARVGGDEFIVVGERGSSDEIEVLKSRIDAVSESMNDGKFPFTLTLSMGYALIESGEINYDRVYRLADTRMYDNKAKKCK